MVWKHILAALFISIILPFLIDALVALAANEKILLGILTFVIVSLIDIQIANAKTAKRIDAELSEIEAKNKFSATLNEVQQLYSRLLEKAGSEKDLFAQAYSTEIADVLNRMRKTVSTGEFSEDKFHLVHTDVLLSIFSETSADEYLDIFVLDDEYDVFDHYSMNYFVKKLDLISKGSLDSIRSIFVIDSKRTPIAGDLAEILSFYKRKRGLDFVLIDKSLYCDLFANNMLDKRCIDFALYGQRYLYKTVSYEPTVEGIFTNNETEIDQFSQFFEACWSSAAAWKPKDLPNDGPLDISDMVARIQFQRPLMLENQPPGQVSKKIEDEIHKTKN